MTHSIQELRIADGTIEVNSVASNGNVDIVAVACGKFDAFAKLDWPVELMQPRGYGKSVISRQGPFELADYMGDIDSVIKRSQRSKTVLFGYSHGGYFAAMHALGNQAAISALILVEPALYTARDDLLDRMKMAQSGKQEEAIRRMLRFVEPGIGFNSNAVNQTTKEIEANINDPRTLADEFRIRAENPVTDEDLALLKIPVLLIGGSGSQMGFMVKRAAQAIPFASVGWVRGATHLELQDDRYAAQIAAIIDSFLQNLT